MTVAVDLIIRLVNKDYKYYIEKTWMYYEDP